MISFSDQALAERFFKMADDVATIKESLKDLPDLKKQVESHDRIITFGKYLSVPILAFLHISFKHILKTLGWS